MSESIIKIENILKSEYSTEGFVSLVTEIFDSMRIVAPNKKNKEYSNFNSHIETYSHIGSYTSPDNKKIAVLRYSLKLQAMLRIQEALSVVMPVNSLKTVMLTVQLLPFLPPAIQDGVCRL